MKNKFKIGDIKIGDKFTWLTDKTMSYIAEIIYIDSEYFKYKYIKHVINSEIGKTYAMTFDVDMHLFNCPEYLK